MFDPYRGVIAYVRVKDGSLPSRERIRLMATRVESDAEEAGVMAPEATPVDSLGPGEVGYLVTGLKDVHQAKVGDTITLAGKHGATEPLPGYREPKPMVWSGLFPAEGGDYSELREALDRLKLSDSALQYEPETSHGARVRVPLRVPGSAPHGHREGAAGARVRPGADRDRAERRVPRVRGEERIVVHNPAEMPVPGTFDRVEEPIVFATIITPADFLGHRARPL